MIKTLIKTLSVIFLIVILSILYLSFVGIKTEKFNDNIASRLLKINNNLKIDFKEIKFLINPFNFTANIATKDPTIILDNNKIQLNSIETNISLKSLISNEFAIGELKISTKSIKIDNVILLARSFKNSTELFLLNKIIKDGFLIADIKLNFNKSGKIKKIIK